MLEFLLSDEEFPRTMAFFSGRRTAQKFLFCKKFPSKAQARWIVLSQVFSWVGLLAAVAVGISLAIKAKIPARKDSPAHIDGWMLASGIVHAVAHAFIGAVSLTLECRLIDSTLIILSLAAAGLIYLHINVPKAIGWAELGVRVVSPLVLCSDWTQAFLITRPGSYYMLLRLPSSMAGIWERLRPKLLYARLFFPPVLWPLLSLMICGLTLALVWTDHLAQAVAQRKA